MQVFQFQLFFFNFWETHRRCDRPTAEERPVYRQAYGTAWHDGIRNLFLHETDFSTSERIETTS